MHESTTTKGDAGGIPVFCAFDNIVDLADMKPNPKNPNNHPDDQIELLAKIIKAQGWRAPVTVSTLSGMIVRGHGRYMAAKLIGCPVPVDYQHYDSEESELADLVADNRIAELSDLDNKMLADIFREIELSDMQLEISGYSDDEVANILSGIEINDTEDGNEPEEYTEDSMTEFNYKEQYGVIVMCANESEQETVYNTLLEMGYSCKVVAT